SGHGMVRYRMRLAVLLYHKPDLLAFAFEHGMDPTLPMVEVLEVKGEAPDLERSLLNRIWGELAYGRYSPEEKARLIESLRLTLERVATLGGEKTLTRKEIETA